MQNISANATDLDLNEAAFATDNPERIHYAPMPVNFRYESQDCSGGCLEREKTRTTENLRNYIRMPGATERLRWTPATIAASDYREYGKWMTSVNKKYNRRYLMNRSVGKGYVFEEFHPKLYVPDMWVIHHSATERSGGAMRGAYLRTIEEMGGYPKQLLPIPQPSCELHWSRYFGIFEPLPGHSQGVAVVNQRLLAYISVRRVGDIALYSQVMGHHAHLDEGVMYHLHFKIVEWLANPSNAASRNLVFLMYGGVGNGGKTLWQWKNKVGFRPTALYAA